MLLAASTRILRYEIRFISGPGSSCTISSLLDKVKKGAEVRTHIQGHSFSKSFSYLLCTLSDILFIA